MVLGLDHVSPRRVRLHRTVVLALFAPTGEHKVHFWPFTGWIISAEKSAMEEVHPSPAQRIYERWANRTTSTTLTRQTHGCDLPISTVAWQGSVSAFVAR